MQSFSQRPRHRHPDGPAELDSHNVLADHFPFFFAKALEPIANGLASGLRSIEDGTDPLLLNIASAGCRNWMLRFHDVPYTVHLFEVSTQEKLIACYILFIPRVEALCSTLGRWCAAAAARMQPIGGMLMHGLGCILTEHEADTSPFGRISSRSFP